ncbi:MAG: flagellar basal body-associated FliL family protein [Parasphingorhabdus sp.]|nr:flagellar basal body-associated FliL family protein [Parasphingorhabdus sp.]
MSTEERADAPPKKGGKLKKLLMALVIVAIVGGGGAAAGFFVAGSMAHEAKPHEDADRPQLVAKDGTKIEGAKAPSGNAPSADPSKLKATYYQVEAPFTSNLSGSDSFVQLGLAIGTYYDEKVIANLKTHEVAVRSAVLMTLAEQDAEALSTQSGKRVLQGLLTRAINDVLNAKTGFGGVDNVYFTNFVVQ